MTAATDLYSSPQWKTYTATPEDDDAIKTSIATSASAATYSGAGLNGVIGAGAIRFTQRISATTSASVGTYKTGAGNAITVTGTNEAGDTITDTITLSASGGGETKTTTKGFASVTSIAVPGQNDTSGTFKFGVEDIQLLPPARAFRSGAAANQTIVDQAGNSDATPFGAGETQELMVARVDVSACSYPFTVLR